MPEHGLGHVQACAARLAVLDTDGVPLPGAENLYVTDALSEMTWEPTYEDGAEIIEKNACGKVKVDLKDQDSLRYYALTWTFIVQDPFLDAFLFGSLLESGDARGWKAPPIGLLPVKRVSIELWVKRPNDGDVDVDYPYAWWVLPRVYNIRRGQASTADSQPVTSAYTARAIENANWYDGPLNDWPVLDAPADATVQWIETNTIPTTSVGYQALAAS